MRILLVEPYFTGSHRAWAEGYRTNSSHDVELVTLQGQFWRWRMTGGHIPLAGLIERSVDRNGPVDVIVTTSMTNVPALLAHTRVTLADVPVVLYMHENQLTYIDRSKPADYAYAAINWSSMTAADLVVFNSEFHRRSWFDSARTWLGSFPDHPHAHAIDGVEAASRVVPVGIDLRRLDGSSRRGDVPQILWNHRADTDKAPERFVGVVLELAEAGHVFTVAICGERFVDSGDVFAPLESSLGDHVVHNGFADAHLYRELLLSSDIVVSTALQEFYGVAITEAVYCGAFPVLPHRLVYPERIPDRFHERCLYRSRRLGESLSWALRHPEERAAIAAELVPEMAASDWSAIAPTFDGVVAAAR